MPGKKKYFFFKRISLNKKDGKNLENGIDNAYKSVYNKNNPLKWVDTSWN
ncbi:hypothetical protein AMI01nite_25920 [Aneurinibacillus migulanus]|nr:hypothetical protein AMI01nite_25920 [Aneurinibacillus migulanus]